MITSEQFYKGRDKLYASELTDEIRTNAVETIRRANLLIERFMQLNPGADPHRGCNSGWRPSAINGATPRAAKLSKHLLGLAIDITDADHRLGKWVTTEEGKGVLEEIGLWAEHHTATPGWCHVQTVPPRSGNRIFYP